MYCTTCTLHTCVCGRVFEQNDFVSFERVIFARGRIPCVCIISPRGPQTSGRCRAFLRIRPRFQCGSGPSSGSARLPVSDRPRGLEVRSSARCTRPGCQATASQLARRWGASVNVSVMYFILFSCMWRARRAIARRAAPSAAGRMQCSCSARAYERCKCCGASRRSRMYKLSAQSWGGHWFEHKSRPIALRCVARRVASRRCELLSLLFYILFYSWFLLTFPAAVAAAVILLGQYNFDSL